ncbi:MAG: 16S rRNA (guanine(966)-N(2))-methyltransferase RsmD [Planctomycetia bacterium]|nr:16S rRNA (guanine(966)-N(2))-methyltransferase RsmD [Planctomycetia bacterium]
MQIVAGKYRHRKLESNPGETTRPITARVKVALFDRIQPQLQGARIADVFSGTGTIGLEALSRGAASVVFIESDRRAFERLRRNVASLHAENETLCWQTDASKCSFHPRGGERFLPYDVVFFDPPYLFTTRLKAGTMLYRSLERLAREMITSPEALLVFRCAAGATFDMPDVWAPERMLNYSSMDVHLFRKKLP